MTVKQIISSLLIASFSLSSFAYAQSSSCVGFPDLDANSRYCSAVKYVNQIGVMTGQGDGYFLPDATLTRAEAAAVLVRYLKEPVSGARDYIAKFPDAAKNEWYSGYFELLIEKGIFEGYPDGTLRPGNTLTKAEWLKLFYVTNKLKGSTTERHVNDVAIQADTAWYRLYLNDAIENDLIDLSAGSFFPAAGQKRVLVADLINRLDNVSVSGQSVENDPVKIDNVEPLYASRFGATSADMDQASSLELAFGINYPGSYSLVWAGSDPSWEFLDDNVSLNAGLGKTTVGRVTYTGGELTGFADFVKRTVERYDGDGANDLAVLDVPIRYWQFDNDDLSASEYANVAKVFYEAVKSADLNAKVLQGVQYSLSEGNKSFWREVYTQIGTGFIDIAAFGGNSNDLKGYKDFINGAGINKPIWLIGITTNSSLNADLEAHDLFRRIVKAFSDGADKVIYGTFDSRAGSDQGKVLVINDDRKESFFVFETLITYLGNFTSVTANGTSSYTFKTPSVEISAVWDGSKPSNFSSATVGVNYLGLEATNEEIINTTITPLLLWF